MTAPPGQAPGAKPLEDESDGSSMLSLLLFSTASFSALSPIVCIDATLLNTPLFAFKPAAALIYGS